MCSQFIQMHHIHSQYHHFSKIWWPSITCVIKWKSSWSRSTSKISSPYHVTPIHSGLYAHISLKYIMYILALWRQFVQVHICSIGLRIKLKSFWVVFGLFYIKWAYFNFFAIEYSRYQASLMNGLVMLCISVGFFLWLLHAPNLQQFS